ncbi:holo-ACP synthase [Falsibacillus albus]|uniref:Holo-[acyl-carrier-protein] synthase n=1 Tax=Falsibacillus albus TaxID=2478915 RepID=A0A3L7JR85_9BACI|nr:holo-ACP synthase [Falsibacillus albus]RLQ93176.1 holo-ACP synthase [Falsibacillus albus]
MIKGIGMDLIELDRIQRLASRQERFAERILTINEQRTFSELHGRRKIEFLAGRFAAKEAFSKAYGTGIGEELSLQDMEIASDDMGKPYFLKPFRRGVHLSITHSRDFAAAQVVIEEI